MASIIHRPNQEVGVYNWISKAGHYHFVGNTSSGQYSPWRYIIAKGNRIDGIEALE